MNHAWGNKKRLQVETALRSLIRREGWKVTVGALQWNQKPYYYVGLYDKEQNYYPIDKIPATGEISCDIKTKIMLIAG